MGDNATNGSLPSVEMRMQVAKVIIENNGRIVPIKYKSKEAAIKKYVQRATTDLNVISQWPAKYGIAVLFDSELVDIETDSLYALKARKYVNLPPTHFSWGRGSAPGAHLLYRTNGKLRFKTISSSIPSTNDEERTHLIEIRTGSVYSILPPSIHKDGMPYEFTEFGEILPITEEFYEQANLWAGLTLLAENWAILEGSRSTTAGALAAFLRKEGWEPEKIFWLITSVCEIAQDEELANRIDFAQRSIERVDQNQETTGHQVLQETLGSETWKRIRVHLGITPLRGTSKYDLTEAGFALRLIEKYEPIMRACPEVDEWYIWDDTRWQQDKLKRRFEFARDIRQNVLDEITDIQDKKTSDAIYSFWRQAGKNNFISSAISLAGNFIPEIKIWYEDLDNNPWLFNCANGTLNLKTGQLQAFNPEDYLTKITSVIYEPNADGPNSEKFLNQVFHNDQELIDYVFRLFGIAMIGEQVEHILPVFQGIGGNGKSTLLEVVAEVFGDYAKKALTDLFLTKYQGGHTAELVTLKGVRFAYSSEGLDTGQKFAEGKIKGITGGDRIAARDVHKPAVEFNASHTIFLATNTLPDIRSLDEGIKRRVKFIPFTAAFKENPQLDNEYKADPLIKSKLLHEKEWWLARIFRGCLEYQKRGLADPESIKQSTDEFFDDIDPLSEWTNLACEIDPRNSLWSVGNIELYGDYCQYADAKRERRISQRNFSAYLKNKNLTNRRGTGGYVQWNGIRLKEKRPNYDMLFKKDVLSLTQGWN